MREDSPDWLKEETERVRKGLMALRQNVVLLPDPDDPDAFYPRCVCVCVCVCVCGWGGGGQGERWAHGWGRGGAQ